ncbi:hypothetical protein L9F63_022470, partial [Diploptera punctata]
FHKRSYYDDLEEDFLGVGHSLETCNSKTTLENAERSLWRNTEITGHVELYFVKITRKNF